MKEGFQGAGRTGAGGQRGRRTEGRGWRAETSHNVGKMIRVLHVINWFRRGGVETQLLQILRDYDRSRFRMDVCCFGSELGYLAPEAKRYGAEIFHCPKSVNLYSLSRRFERFLSGNKFDIVHTHSEAWSGPILRGAANTRVPVRIAHIRSSLPQGFRLKNPALKIGRDGVMMWGRHWLVKYATHIMGVSAASLNSRFKEWRSLSKCYLWTLGVDVSKFGFSIREKDLNDGPVLIQVGSFIPQRRHDLALRIFSLVCAQKPDARLFFVGEGERLQACRNLAEDLGLTDRVKFLGLRDDIPELLSKADVFLSCSEAEGLPNVVLEAEASGLPVVASDIPPHREALCDTAHQFLFRHDDIQGAVDNVLKILNDPDLYGELRRAGRQFVVEHYDAQTNLKRLEEMYLRWVEEGDLIAHS